MIWGIMEVKKQMVWQQSPFVIIQATLLKEDGLCMSMKLELGVLRLERKV